MKVVTFNVNGLRSAMRKGFFQWLEQEQPDICCLQEVRVPLDLLGDAAFHPPGYHCHYVEAEKKGYSGVGIYSRIPPQKVVYDCGIVLSHKEGRYIEYQYPDFDIVSLYMPSGTSGDLRQQIKYQFMDDFAAWMEKKKSQGKPLIICADWNIAHKPIDLENWKSNQTSSGFLPEERAWIDYLLERSWVDAFREVNIEPEQYSWWSARSKTAWARNVGWRIDYHLVTEAIKPWVQKAWIYRDQQFSDHAPVIVHYNTVLENGALRP